MLPKKINQFYLFDRKRGVLNDFGYYDRMLYAIDPQQGYYGQIM